MTRIPVNAGPTDTAVLERTRDRAKADGKPRLMLIPVDPTRSAIDLQMLAESQLGSPEWAALVSDFAAGQVDTINELSRFQRRPR